MKLQISYISEALKDALIFAWTADRFKSAKVTLELTCSDGSTATITETLDGLVNNIDNSGSSTQQSPPRSPVDQLGDIKKNNWF
jgi:hypothetical protein